MTRYHWRLVIKMLVIVVPSFGVAIITAKMVYTIPVLASATFLASHLFEDERPQTSPDFERLIEEETEAAEIYES